MNANTNFINSTNINAYGIDSFKILAKNFGFTVREVAAIAADLELDFDYSRTRRTWHLTGHPSIARRFFNHLAELTV